MTEDALLIFAGALIGGFVSGLTGFGTGISAMPIWLLVTPPVIAAQLAASCGLLGQLQTLPRIWSEIRWRAVGPFIIAGLIGVPIGIYFLPMIPLPMFRLGIGILLVIFCGIMLMSGETYRLKQRYPAADLGVGFAGGLLAGLAGLSGPIPTAWSTLQTWSRDEKRALFQSFNMTILAAMLTASALTGLMSWAFARAFAFALFGTIIGVAIGGFIYQRLDTRGFDRIVLAVLMISGLSLIWTSLA
ncbi:MAG: sulfite exporter TauE/SafE family protein [Pseudomonadota bacterium]